MRVTPVVPSPLREGGGFIATIEVTARLNGAKVGERYELMRAYRSQRDADKASKSWAQAVNSGDAR
mgnify:CR=1 FL=1